MSGIFCFYWRSVVRRFTALVVIFAFTISPSTIYAQPVLGLPEPGTMVLQSQAFVPVVLRAVRVRPDQPLVFDFVVDSGNTGLEGEALKREIEKIAKYFLATLTIPQKDLWVNLSPYEKDRIIADEFGQTEMGRDMLAQDYMLKQLASSLVNPDTALGRAYWDRLYARAQEVLGTTEIPMDTFNKVWIVPEEAVIYEKGQAAILGEARLKLMMEEDYLALKKNGESTPWAERIQQQANASELAASGISSQVMREVILPEIEKEVNTGKNFAPLRQIFSALILATWYKEAVKDSLISRMYEDQKKIAGVDIQDANMREKIFEQYVAAYKKGVFDFIREDMDPVSGEALPRRYFSGGVSASEASLRKTPITGQESAPLGLNPRTGKEFMVTFVAGKAQLPARISLESRQPMNSGYEGAMTQEDREFLLSSGAPQRIKDMIVSGEISSGEHAAMMRFLLDQKQARALEHMGALTTTDEQVLSMLEQLFSKNRSYPGGLERYFSNFRKALKEKEEKISLFTGSTLVGFPSNVRDYRGLGESFENAHQQGLKRMRNTVLAMVAGGAGKRLGAENVKIGLEADPVTGKTFIQIYCEKILQAQGESERLNGSGEMDIPFFIMTSDETHSETVRLLEANRYFGLNGVSVVDPSWQMVVRNTQGKLVVVDRQKYLAGDVTGAYIEDLKQVIIAKQESVFELQVSGVQLTVDQKNPGRFAQAGHGHNDIHILMHSLGLAQAFLEAGKEATFFFQDTNKSVFNALFATLAGLGGENTISTTAIARNPRERVGAYGDFRTPEGKVVTVNAEYTILDQLAKTLGLTESDFKDANINVMGFDQKAYVDFLGATSGVTPEMVNPKEGKARLEGNYQDAMWKMRGKVLVNRFDPRFAFNTTKNSVAETLGFIGGSMRQGKTWEETGSTAVEFRGWSFGEANRLNQLFLEKADVQIPSRTVTALYQGNYRYQVYEVSDAKEKKEVVYIEGFNNPEDRPDRKATEGQRVEIVFDQPFPGIPFSDGAAVKFSSRFALSPADIRSKIMGGSISADSVVSLDGKDLFLKDVSVQGAVFITVAQGAKATLNGVRIQNDGWEKVWLTLKNLQAPDQFPESARMHGFYYKKNATTRINVVQGEVRIGEGSSDVLARTVNLTIVNKSGELFDLDQHARGLAEYTARQAAGLLVGNNINITVSEEGKVSVSESAQASLPERISENVPTGGVDFVEALESIRIERTGSGIKVHVDPAEILRIQAGGFEGLSPIIIEVVPVQGILPALGLVDNSGGRAGV